MSAQPQNRELDRVQLRCQDWSEWVNSDYLTGLGYPSATSEARTIFGESGKYKNNKRQMIQHKLDAMRWQANAKNSRCAKISLPDWKVELAMDVIINNLPAEFQRVLYCRYEVRVKPEQLQALNLDMRKLHLVGHDGRYNWPRYQKDRIAVLRGMTERTFYRSSEWAHQAIIDSDGYFSIR